MRKSHRKSNKFTFSNFVKTKKGASLLAAVFIFVSVITVSASTQAACWLFFCTPDPVTVEGGYATHVIYESDADSYVKLAADGGAKYIRDDVNWAYMEQTKGVIDWSVPDRIVGSAAKHGMSVLLLVDTAPSWATGVPVNSIPNWHWAAPINVNDYADFAGKVAARYGTNGTFWAANPTIPKILPAGIEVWNEPNLAQFWGGKTPDPAKYTAMLKAAYKKIKAADSKMKVITAGLSPQAGYNDIDCNGVADSGSTSTKTTGLNYLEDMYDNGAKGSFDAVGWHAYMYIKPTAAQMMATHNCSGWSQMEDTSPSVRSMMSARWEWGKKVWVTETGAPTCVAGATYPCLSETEQSNLAKLQAEDFSKFSLRGLFFWYDLRDDFGGDSLTNGEEHYGALRANNSAKPAYTTLKTYFAQ